MAADQQVTTAEDTAVVITVEASDPDGDSLTFELGKPGHGTVAGTPPDVTYLPDRDYHGQDKFLVHISDETETVTVTIDITITSVNDSPLADDQVMTTARDTAITVTLVARDVDTAVLAYTIVAPPASGTLSGDDAVKVYTPSAGFRGEDGFTFRASDGSDESNLARVTIAVIDENCGNGTLDPTEECDDGNTTSGDRCSALCVLERCGDGIVNNDGEACDDGNQVAGDGCRADCRGQEICGDGFIDSLVGEQCDDSNTTPGDGCSSECLLEQPFTSVSPRLISGGLRCMTMFSSTGRKTAVDQLGRFYAVMNCGGQAYVATSADRGITWSAPVATGISNVNEVAIEGGAAGVAYVAAISRGLLGSLVFTRTGDGGASYAPAITLASGLSVLGLDSEVSMDSFEESVFIALAIAGGTGQRIFRNLDSGQEGFTSTDLVQLSLFHDIIADKITGDILSICDTPTFYLRTSTDQGRTFSSELQLLGAMQFADWIGSNGFVYAVGTVGSSTVEVIPIDTPLATVLVDGLPASVGYNPVRAIDADALGNAYVVSGLDNGNVELDRMRVGTNVIDGADARVFPSGSYPSVAALPSNNGALVTFTRGTAVYAAVTVY